MGLFDNPLLTKKVNSDYNISQESGGFSSYNQGYSSAYSKKENIIIQGELVRGHSGNRRREVVIEEKIPVKDQTGRVVAMEGKGVVYEGYQSQIDQQKELRKLQSQGYNTSNIVFNQQGQGFSSAGMVNNPVIPESRPSSNIFYAPRMISGQETVSLSPSIDLSGIPVSEPVKYSGTVDVFNKYDYMRPRESSITQFEAGIGESLVDAGVLYGGVRVVQGSLAGILAPAKISYNTFVDPAGQIEKVKIGAVEVVKNPAGKLIGDPLYAVISDPFYELPKLGIELFELKGFGDVGRTVVGANKFRNVDVRASAVENVPSVTTPFEQRAYRKSFFIDESQLLRGNIPFILDVEKPPTGQSNIFGGFAKGKAYQSSDYMEFKVQGSQSRLNDLAFKPEFDQIVAKLNFNHMVKGDFSSGVGETFNLNPFDTILEQKNLLGESAIKRESVSQVAVKPKPPAIKEQQITLQGKKTFGSTTFRDVDTIEVKDATSSTQQAFNIIDAITINEFGDLSLEKTFKLRPVTEQDVLESTSQKSTQFYTPKKHEFIIDTMSEDISGYEKMFNKDLNGKTVDLKGKSKSMAGSSNSMAGFGTSSLDIYFSSQQVQVFAEQPSGKLVNLIKEDINPKTGYITRKIGETKLNQDILGKVTPERGFLGIPVRFGGVFPNIEQPANISINKNVVKNDFIPSISNDYKTQTDYTNVNDIVIINGQRSGGHHRTRIDNALKIKQDVGLKQEVGLNQLQLLRPKQDLRLISMQDRAFDNRLGGGFRFPPSEPVGILPPIPSILPRFNKKSLGGLGIPFRKSSFKSKKSGFKFDIVASLPEVFSYEARTGRESYYPKKTKRTRYLFESQVFGLGNFDVLIKLNRRGF